MYNSGPIYILQYKFIVKTFIINNLGKNTIIQWKNTILINGIMEKEYVQLYFQHFICQHVCHKSYL